MGHDDLIARPGDLDLDCHLTGLRLTAVTESPAGDYQFEAALGFDTAAADGWWVEPDGSRFQPDRITHFSICFGYDVHPGYELHGMLQMSRLRQWRDEGALVRMTAAPGKWTLLASGTGRVVVPRKEPSTAGLV